MCKVHIVAKSKKNCRIVATMQNALTSTFVGLSRWYIRKMHSII
nr:MAG TPA: hypothetical protein [Caudoviricetes sp.]